MQGSQGIVASKSRTQGAVHQNFPPALAGQRIGLLGGSFDPAHAGHTHITRWALKTFGLDAVWWLVSPGNPLKAKGPAPMLRRLERARSLVSHPRVRVTDLEVALKTRYTADTLRAIRQRYPGVSFVWLMGADNLAQFHLWDEWRWILDHVPVGVLARPGEQLQAGLSPAARAYAHVRLPARRARALSHRAAPVWTLLTGPMIDLSSSEIRARGDW